MEDCALMLRRMNIAFSRFFPRPECASARKRLGLVLARAMARTKRCLNATPKCRRPIQTRTIRIGIRPVRKIRRKFLPVSRPDPILENLTRTTFSRSRISTIPRWENPPRLRLDHRSVTKHNRSHSLCRLAKRVALSRSASNDVNGLANAAGPWRRLAPELRARA